MLAFKPSAALAAHVADLWVWEIPAAPQMGDAAAITLLPDGHPTMVFNYGGALTASDGRQTFTTRSALCGFQPRPVRVTCDGPAAGITVRFRPWSLARFVPGSMEEATGRRIECRDLYAPGAVDDLESQLRALPTPLARVRQVERFLLERLRVHDDDALVCAMVQQLAGAGGITRVALWPARWAPASARWSGVFGAWWARHRRCMHAWCACRRRLRHRHRPRRCPGRHSRPTPATMTSRT